MTSLSDKPRGLIWACQDKPGITRRRTGKSFTYRGVDGKIIRKADDLARIKSLVIPPAWTDVWIAPQENSHIQAVGIDARGRKQYRYHAKFREARDNTKFEHMMAFAASLPKLRARVARDMAKPGVGRDKVLATVVHLLETTSIRVGNASYAKTNKSYGLTTLLDRHVKISGSELKFHFTGKSGKTWRLGIRDRRIANVVKSCQDIPGQHLFQYIDDHSERQAVSSSDVNRYLHEITGAAVTAKDFRTWTGTVLAAMALSEFERADSQAAAKRNVRKAIESVAEKLGNTPTVCRKCYVHPEVLGSYLNGDLALRIRKDIDETLAGSMKGLKPEEGAVLAFLRTRLSRDVKQAA